MICDGFIPYAIPDPIQELQLTSLEVKELQPQRFCHLDNSWSSLTSLAFEYIIAYQAFSLPGGVFDCLENLVSFRFQGYMIEKLDNFTFTGLSNVTRLDLSGCSHLVWDYLYDMFSLIRNFPKLDHLILSGVGSNGFQLNLDDAFIDVLSMRPLEYLDLSYTNIKFNFENGKNICTTLKYLSVAGARKQFWRLFARNKPCNSLEIVDMSKSYDTVFDNFRCVDVEILLDNFYDFFKDVDVVIQNEIITFSTNFVCSNCHLLLYNRSSITEYHFSQNYLPNFDILLINHRMKLLDLSKDSIADINPKAFEGMSSLRELDLSCNELSNVTDFEKRFSELFSYSSDLTYVHLNGNGLLYLPNEVFVSNLNLEHLDLSNNSLTQVDFAISHLLDLQMLNLRLNNIESLDETSRRSLDALYANQIKANKTETVQVQLHDNPLSCHCACLGFLQWLVNAPMFSATRHEYKCQLDGRQFLLDADGLNAARDECERERQKRLKTILLSTLLPSAALIIIVTSILLYKRYKKNLLRQRFADGIRRLRKNADRFPVFLSYSSEDKDFVRSHMLQPMQVLGVVCYLCVTRKRFCLCELTLNVLFNSYGHVGTLASFHETCAQN